ncbi:MAG: lamin tail domain-containing protein [Candidatus Cloacimonadaceae bacterium]
MKRTLLFLTILIGLFIGLPAKAESEFLTIPVNLDPGELLINEIQAKNASYADPHGEFDDWVEIYNPNNYAIDLGGMYMTDNHYAQGVTAWTQIPTGFSALTTIPAYGFLIVWFDENLTQGPLHINTKLSGAADAVYLIDSDGFTVVDSYAWTEATGLNVDDVSIGRLPDGGSSWQLFGAGHPSPCTPGASNQGIINSAPVISNLQYTPYPATQNSVITISAQVTDPDNNLLSVQLLWGINNYTLNTVNMTMQGGVYTASLGPFALNSVIQFRIKATDTISAQTFSPIHNITIGFSAPVLYINEVMASNTTTITDNYGEYEDWIEIYNPNDFAVNLAGYYLVDNHYGDPAHSLIPISSAYPDSTTIPAYGFKIIWFDEEPYEGILHINTKLSATADAVYLIAPDMLHLVDNIAWTVATELSTDLSYGRYPDGSENWILFGNAYPHQVTPGTSNSSSANENDTNPPLLPGLAIYPNPMNSILNIAVKNSKVPAKVGIYNLKGQLVRELTVNPGVNAVWDGKDKSGLAIASGLYFMKTKLSGKVFTRKFIKLY